MSKQRKYVEYDFVVTVHPIRSPRTGGIENTFGGGPLANGRGGFRFYFDGPFLCIEEPTMGAIAEVPFANIKQTFRIEKPEEST